MSEPTLNSCDTRRARVPPPKPEAIRSWQKIGAILEDGSLKYERGRREFDDEMALVMAYRWAQTPR